MENYYLVSVSIAATLFCILLAVWIGISIWLVFRTKRLLARLDTLSDSTADIARNVNELVRTSTQRIISIEKAFLTAQGLKEAAHLVTTMFNNRKTKGAPYESE